MAEAKWLSGLLTSYKYRSRQLSVGLVAVAALLVCLICGIWTLEEARYDSVGKFSELEDIRASSMAGTVTPPHWLIAGPWMTEGSTGAVWTIPTHCNPYSGACACLRTWGVDVCNSTENIPTISLGVNGWLRDWPYRAGLHRCSQSFCNISHHSESTHPHAQLFSIIDAAHETANAQGAILVGVALESRTHKPLHSTTAFRYFFDLGVSYAHRHLDLQTSYNNYFPGQFKSQGAPFAQKRTGLAFMYSNCGWAVRDRLFEQFAALTVVESFGPCHHNTDIADILPQCAGLARTGNTVWLESECVLHHFKFYLAIENAIDDDYVTEKLYQGLRAGSVPIYYGARNVRDYLPHPDAVLLIEDFSDIASLVAYVERASQNESLYQRHMAWKSGRLPETFLETVVGRPVDSVFCQVCDTIAAGLAANTLGPQQGGRGGSVTLPPCIVSALRQSSSFILRDWISSSSSSSPPRPPSYPLRTHIPTYVLSVATARDRHASIRAQLRQVGLSADLVSAFDAAGLSDDAVACFHPRSPLDQRPLQERVPGKKELSLAMKHIAVAWDVFSRGIEVALVLEDDAILLPDFVPSIEKALAEAPPVWHMIFAGSCLGLHAANTDSSRCLWPANSSRCTHAYLVSYEGARQFLASLPLRWVADFQINMAATLSQWTIFWMEPPCAVQGANFTSLLSSDRGE